MKRATIVLAGLLCAALLTYATVTAQPAGGRRMPRLPIVAAIDADGDGELSAGEIAKASEALAKLDRNKDGKLSPQEYFPRFGGRFGPGAGRPAAPSGGSIAFESKTLAKDEAEKKILAVLDVMDRNERRGMMNVPVEDGRLLRLLAEAIGAKHIVEVGTSNGFSAIWQCLALRKTGGKLTTFEIDAHRAALARKNFQRAGVEGLVTLVEGDAHKEVPKVAGPIDMVFLDADKPGYIDYLQKLLPKLRPGGLVVAHNMNQRQADPKYVKAITTNPELETLFLHMQGAGVAVSMKKR